MGNLKAQKKARGRGVGSRHRWRYPEKSMQEPCGLVRRTSSLSPAGGKRGFELCVLTPPFLKREKERERDFVQLHKQPLEEERREGEGQRRWWRGDDEGFLPEAGEWDAKGGELSRTWNGKLGWH